MQRLMHQNRSAPVRTFSLIFLVCAAFVLTVYSMPGLSSAVSFIASLALTLVSVLLLRVRRLEQHPPISLMMITLVLPFILGVVVAVEGIWNWRSGLQVFVVWGLTITFWFNFLTVPLAYYHTRLEARRGSNKMIFPPISIILPAYNEEKVIAGTVEALIETDYPAPKEVIVVDDGSTDRTHDIAKRYESEDVRIFKKTNGGKHSAINYGLLFASYSVIVTVDADTIIGRGSLKELVRSFSDPNVAGVAGNVVVLNKVNLLTKCQALEYVLTINSTRRMLDLFGTVPVVPGVLGAFRKNIMDSVGRYDSDTLTEDFDITMKCLKTGKIVQASSNALAFTEAPTTLMDLYRQRIRWYRGNVQTVLKHRNVLSTRRFGILHALTYPFLLINLFIIPFLTIPVWISAALTVLAGYWQEVVLILMLFTTLQMLLSALALEFSQEEWNLILYSPLFVVGYKQLIDSLVAKATVDVLTKRKNKWTSVRRYGTGETRVHAL